MKKHFFWTFLTIAVIIIITGGYFIPVSAQSSFVTWSEPINISNTPNSSQLPAIAADPFGNIHVFWSEDAKGIPSKDTFKTGTSIYYKRWDGQHWSGTIDIYNTSSNYGYSAYPSAATDHEGNVHLVWRGLDGIHYSSLNAGAPFSAQSWSPEEIITYAGGEDSIQIMVDNQNVINLVYSQWRPSNGTKDGNIYFQNSENGGISWSPSVPVSNISKRVETTAGRPRIVRGNDDILHIVWYESDPPDWLGARIFYAHSSDEGISWSEPYLIYDRLSIGYASMPEISLRGENSIILTWACAIKKRCSSWSPDKGNTWSPVQQLFGNLWGLAGWDTVITTPKGDIFWFLSLIGSALDQATWNNGRWSEPVPIGYPGPEDLGYNLDAVLQNGNEIHLVMMVWDEPYPGEIYYMKGTMDTAYLPPKSIPTLKPTARIKTTSTPQAFLTPTLIPGLNLNDQITPLTPRDNSYLALLAGFGPVLILLAFIIIVRSNNRIK